MWWVWLRPLSVCVCMCPCVQCFGSVSLCACIFVHQRVSHREIHMCTTHTHEHNQLWVCFSFNEKEYGTERPTSQPSIRIFIVCCMNVVVVVFYIITFTYRLMVYEVYTKLNRYWEFFVFVFAHVPVYGWVSEWVSVCVHSIFVCSFCTEAQRVMAVWNRK